MSDNYQPFTIEQRAHLRAVLATVREKRLPTVRIRPVTDGRLMLRKIQEKQFRAIVRQHCLDDGLHRLVVGLDDERSAVEDPQTGTLTAFPIKVGVRSIDGAGKQLSFFERADFWNLTRDEWKRWADSQRRQFDKLGQKLRQISRVDTILRRHPAAKTVGEACDAAQVDRRSIALPPERKTGTED